ncbi:MAG: CBS domain-containing protein [Planctomycetaceae bacterium]|nr:CBS domain-containing protein [Planctomycetaceae bacterium]
MGETNVGSIDSLEQRRRYAQLLLNDLKAIRIMQAEGMFESGVYKIGAEQELFVLDDDFRPSLNGPEVLQALNHPNFTHEVARFTMEINLDPVTLAGPSFSTMDRQLVDLMALADQTAERLNKRLIAIGILPTIGIGELDSKYMTPLDRYRLMEKRIIELRGGGDTELAIQGVDDMMMKHDNILFEACNTSFQVHLQIEPKQFVDAYNWAQAISGIVLSIGTNSPLLMGRELWSETRIALFQQSVDTRTRDAGLRQRQARVYFGNRWIRDNLLEIFQEDVARYPLLITGEPEDSLELLRRGVVPKLRALALHNGTIWKWNRVCFGSNGQQAHLRIENRYLPAGPTTMDEMANAAFWVGLMRGMPASMKRIWEKMDFREAKDNFLKAAQHGMDVELSWMGQTQSARRLILDYFLPMAWKGLLESGVDSRDVSKYLSIIEHRAVTRMTGSKWQRQYFRATDSRAETYQRQIALTREYWQKQRSGLPVADWTIGPFGQPHSLNLMQQRVDTIMSTDLITVGQEDLFELALQIMWWRNIQHLPVEDTHGQIVGLLSRSDFLPEFRQLEWEYLKGLDALQTDEGRVEFDSLCGDRMIMNPVCIPADQTVGDAKSLMLEKKIGSLPVVKKGKLVGIVTKRDILRLERANESLNR